MLLKKMLLKKSKPVFFCFCFCFVFVFVFVLFCFVFFCFVLFVYLFVCLLGCLFVCSGKLWIQIRVYVNLPFLGGGDRFDFSAKMRGKDELKGTWSNFIPWLRVLATGRKLFGSCCNPLRWTRVKTRSANCRTSSLQTSLEGHHVTILSDTTTIKMAAESNSMIIYATLTWAFNVRD